MCMQVPTVGSIGESACECRCLGRAENDNRPVSAGIYKGQRWAVGMWMQVPSECRVEQWALECRFPEATSEGCVVCEFRCLERPAGGIWHL